METKSFSRMSVKPIIALAGGLLVILLLGYFFTDIFTYFIVSMVLATIMQPIVRFINGKFLIPKTLSIIFATIFLLMLVVLLGATFAPLIREQINLISSIDINRTIELVQAPIMSIQEWLTDMGVITVEANSSLEGSIKTYVLELISTVNFRGVFNTIFSLTGSVFVALLAISFITFLLASSPGMMRKLLLGITPNHYFEISASALHKIEFLLSRYFRGIFLQMFFIFTIASIGLGISGVKYAITIALFAALINIIPYLGPLMGALFGIIIGVTTSNFAVGSAEFYLLLAKIGIVFGIVQVADNIALQPIIFSKSLKAHPLEIFVIIFAGANLGGPIGMILAIPIYTILKVIITELLRGYKQYRIFQD